MACLRLQVAKKRSGCCSLTRTLVAFFGFTQKRKTFRNSLPKLCEKLITIFILSTKLTFARSATTLFNCFTSNVLVTFSSTRECITVVCSSNGRFHTAVCKFFWSDLHDCILLITVDNVGSIIGIIADIIGIMH